MKSAKKLTTFQSHLGKQYGKIGTKSRKKFDQEFKTYLSLSFPLKK